MVKRFLYILALLGIITVFNNELICQQSSIQTIDSLKKQLRKYNNADTNRINLLNELSFKYYSIDPRLGIENGRKALALAKTLNFKFGIANSYNSLGINYWTMSNYPYALKNLLVALDLFLEIGDTVGIAKINNNIGLIYCLLDMNDKGVKFFRNAMNYGKNQNDTLGHIMNLVNIAGAYRQVRNNNSAIEYYHKALYLVNRYKKDEFKFHIYSNLSIAYLQMKDYVRAYNYIIKAKNENQNFGMQDLYRIAIYKAELARLIFTYLEDTNKSKSRISDLDINNKSLLHDCLSYIQSSINYFDEISATSELKNSYYNLSDVYAKMNRIDSAYFYLRKANVLRDSLAKDNDIVKIKVLEMERDLTIQKNEIKRQQEMNFNYRVSTYVAMTLVIILFVSFVVTFKTAKKNKKLNNIMSEKNAIISQSNIELETLVNELSEKQMEIEEANEKLHIANAAKDKFFSIISHDLRSPFTGIIGLSDLLVSEFNSISKEEIQTISQGINKSAKSTYLLLNGLLEWAKTQLGAVNFNPIACNVLNIYNKVANNLLQVALAKDIYISHNIDSNIYAWCDLEMLSAILRNLISNAIKFTENGGKIYVSAIVADAKVKFSIKDTGVGIKPEILDNIFSLENVTTTQGTNSEKGSGFGLLLCKEFIDKHNGEIWVESTINVGTTFYFTLPKS